MKGFEKKREGDRDGRPSSNSCINGEINTQLRYKNYVPLDYFKVRIMGEKVEHIKRILDFTSPVNTDTGEVILKRYPNGDYKKPRRFAQWFNLNFKLVYSHVEKREVIYLDGSLHTFSNKGQHNHNDFTLEAFTKVLRAFKLVLNVCPLELKIYQLEWGVNICPPVKTNLILEHCLMFNGSKVQNPYNNYLQSGNEKNYLIKAYNKSHQFSLESEIMRVERKQIDWRSYCKKQKIGRTLQDLINSDFKGLKESLISNWMEIILFDPMIKDINPNILKLRDPLYWVRLKENRSRTTFSKKRKQLREINKEKGGDIQNKVAEFIEQKIKELNGDVFTLSKLVFTPNMLTPELRILTTHYGFTA